MKKKQKNFSKKMKPKMIKITYKIIKTKIFWMIAVMLILNFLNLKKNKHYVSKILKKE